MDKDNLKVDLLGVNGQCQGDLAEFFKNNSGLDVGMMRPWRGDCGKSYVTLYKGSDPTKSTSYENQIVANSTLRQDEWKSLDESVLAIARERLVGIQDLVTNGLTYPLGNAMGTTILNWDDISDAMEAVITMDGITRGPGDRPVFTRNSLPIPIIHSDFEINLRALDASRRMGQSLDTLYAERAARRIAEKLEDMLFTNTSYSFGGGTIYSYLNFPDRSPVALATAWDAPAMTAALILADVLSFKQASIDVNHYGPWMLYIPTAYETVLDDDFDATAPGITIRERLMKIDNITGIKVADHLPDDVVLLIEMRKETIRLVQGLGIQNIEWTTEGKFLHKYKVVTIQVPQIISDQEGHSGIIHASVA